jgi:hypothetical protein
MVQLVPSFVILPSVDGAVHLQIDGPAGAIVDVEFSDDLVNWKTAASRKLSGATWFFSDALSPDLEHRYYRAVRHLQ